MAVNTEKKKTWFRVAISWLVSRLKDKYPLWLFIVVFLVAVLFCGIVACSYTKASVQTALVGVTEYRGHTFLVFRAVNNSDGSFSVVHDPDCACRFTDTLTDFIETYGTY